MILLGPYILMSQSQALQRLELNKKIKIFFQTLKKQRWASIDLDLTYDYYAPLFRSNNTEQNITPFSFTPSLPVSNKTYIYDRLLHDETLESTDTYIISERVKKGMQLTDYTGNSMDVRGIYTLGKNIFILKYNFTFTK